MTSTADDLASILDVIQQPAWAVDADHRVSHANASAARFMGYHRPRDLLGLDGRPSVRPRGGTGGHGAPGTLPTRGEGVLTHADGSLVPVVWSLLPLHRPGGETAVYVFLPPSDDDAEPWPERDPFRLPQQQPQPHVAREDARHWRRTADSLQHGAQERLVGLLLGLHLVREQFGHGTGPSSEAIELLDASLRDAEEALAHVREATAATYPGVLKLRGLKAALLAFAALSPLKVTVTGTLEGRLPDPVEMHAYFLVTEAIDRAGRVGGADLVQVRVDVGSALVVCVDDDGDAPRHGDDAAPLAAMTDHVLAVDGTLSVRHVPGSGTSVRAVMPLHHY
ncbi:histidine kinase [Streptomyces sp. S.PB5]|uniref:histidine kinase n=1 Tax=Streptomyces sp. S.PB5 TaxID=3020844 RepID=UPI0025AF586E|nr:histidine kinase [Streptomyces sp. S.PB5]MDN3027050.1 histidine kinase [Streptomyces sp. S.PB5]